MAELTATTPETDAPRSWVTLARVVVGIAAVAGIGIVLAVRLARKTPGLADEDAWLVAWLVVGVVDVLAGAALVRRLGHRRLAACLLLVGAAAVIVVAIATTSDGAPARHFQRLAARDSWAHALATGVLIALVPWELAPTRRRRGFEVVWWSTAALVGLTAIGYAAGVPTRSLDAVDIGIALLAISATAAIARLGLHWWRSGRHSEDPLLGWTVAGAVVAWLAIVPRWLDVIPEFPGDGVLGPALLVATLPLLVVGISVRAMRERPGRFQGLAHEVIGWLVLSGAIVLLYTGVVVVFGEVVGSTGRTWVLVATTCVLAIFIDPARRRVQSGVDRLVWGARDDPLEVVRGVIEHVSADSVDDLLPSVTESLRSELRLDAVAIDVVADGEWSRVATSGEPMTARQRVVELAHHDEVVGRLIVGWEHGPHLRHRDERVLAEIVAPLGLAVGWVRLVDELRRSGAELVAARAEEQRRLRRDLHDGLGPALTGVSLGVRAALSKLDREEPGAVHGARELLARSADEVDALVIEVRRIARDLRPTALDQLGLLGAISALTERFSDQLEFHLSMPSSATSLPAAAEVAVYRIVTEAVTNVVRHAAATECWLTMVIGPDIDVTIVDDGIGLTDGRVAGIGLTAMRERAAELGGRVQVSEVVPHGTSISVRIPASSP